MTTLDLAQFYGTEQWYRHPTYKNILFTDGVKYVVDTAKAYWLLDEIASYYVRNRTKSYFMVFDLDVDTNNHKGLITVSDGNDEVLDEIPLEYTDFPVSHITMWCVDSTILLPSEY